MIRGVVYFDCISQAPPIRWEEPGTAVAETDHFQPLDWSTRTVWRPWWRSCSRHTIPGAARRSKPLAVLLLGVIDCQATVTEDSLRYVITQRLADQKRLDHLAERLEWASYGQEDIP